MIKLPAVLSGFSSRADKSAGVRFATQELLPSDFAELQELNGTFGFLLFKENDIQPDDIPKENAEFEGKTSSERLKDVLFVWFKKLEKEGKVDEDFNTFRRKKMEGFIEAVKSKLDE